MASSVDVLFLDEAGQMFLANTLPISQAARSLVLLGNSRSGYQRAVNLPPKTNLKVTTDIYMQAVGPQKREAQSNLVKLVRKGAVLEVKPD